MLQCKPSACGQAAVGSAQLSRDGGSLNPILCPRTGLLLGAGFSLEYGQHRTTLRFGGPSLCFYLHSASAQVGAEPSRCTLPSQGCSFCLHLESGRHAPVPFPNLLMAGFLKVCLRKKFLLSTYPCPDQLRHWPAVCT